MAHRPYRPASVKHVMAATPGAGQAAGPERPEPAVDGRDAMAVEASSSGTAGREPSSFGPQGLRVFYDNLKFRKPTEQVGPERHKLKLSKYCASCAK